MSNPLFDTYCRVFKEMDVKDTKKALAKDDLLHEEIGYFPAGGKLTILPVGVLMERFTPCTKARLIQVVSFPGGPPGQQQWYSGTLLTYLLDRILWKRHMKVIEMGNTWRKSDKFGDEKRKRELSKNKKRLKKLARKQGSVQVAEENYTDDYENQYEEDN